METTNQIEKEVCRERTAQKLLVIALLCLLLLVPWIFIRYTISERSETELSAEREVFAKWGCSQTLKGPAIDVNCGKDNNSFMLLPETLDINGEVTTRTLNRGIYDFNVYDAIVVLSGEFKLPTNLSKQQLNRLNQNCWKMKMGLTSLKGLTDNPTVKINGRTLNPTEVTFEGSHLVWNTDLSNMLAGKSIHYEITLPLRGSKRISFIPTGNTTTTHLHSDCNTPSFDGNFLPTERNVNNDGFDAEWKILSINRDFAQIITHNTWSNLENNNDIIASLYDEGENNSDEYGVELRRPVEQYQQNERAVKYAYLIILITFAVVFFIELRRNNPIHPVQYLLIGLALILFYALLLSFSEHLSFIVAYLIASAMTIGLLTVYLGAIMHNWKTGILIGIVLTIFYAFIYILLQIESYALLIGSIGLFIVVAIAMAASRKIDWYKQNT